MKVKVLGKFNYKGTGKQSGKPYTCVKVFVHIGGSYDMEYNRKGFVDTFTPAK